MRASVFALVLVTVPLGFAGQPDKKDPPKPLPDDIGKAWKDAGASAGWVNTSGFPEFVEKPEVGAITAFQFRVWKDGVVAKLPAPEVPFGLDLSDTNMTDAGVKELTTLKNLATLHLGSTKVTDAGVKELANQKNLTALVLSYTQVTDAGVKELTTLKNLATLYLGSTKVTDAGLKELANLKNLTHLDLFGTQVTDAGLKELVNPQEPHHTRPGRHEDHRCEAEGTGQPQKPQPHSSCSARR